MNPSARTLLALEAAVARGVPDDDPRVVRARPTLLLRMLWNSLGLELILRAVLTVLDGLEILVRRVDPHGAHPTVDAGDAKGVDALGIYVGGLVSRTSRLLDVTLNVAGRVRAAAAARPTVEGRRHV